MIHEQLKSARRGAGLSRSALGEMLGVQRLSLYRWENGVTDPGLKMVRRIALVLGVRLGWVCPACGAAHVLGGEE